MHSRGNQELCFYKVVLTNFEYSVYNKNYENVGQGNTGETWSDRLKARNGPKRLAWGAAATTRAAETAEPIDLNKLTKWCIHYTTKEAWCNVSLF